ncbi:MAG: cobalt transporter [Oscillospiraceae bacterium]|nr:cobalt transporter [Oscillospiraceae bacterium]
MHIHHDHIGGHHHDHDHEHTHSHTHEHTHDGVTHSHEHTHAHEHTHEHPHDHEHLHEHGAEHTHSHDCGGQCAGCASKCEHTPMEELMALMKYMAGHNAAHAKELADLAVQLEKAGNRMAYEQVMAAVSDFEKGNMRLTLVLQSLDVK